MAQDGEMGPDDPFVFQLLEMESRGKSFLDAAAAARWLVGADRKELSDK